MEGERWRERVWRERARGIVEEVGEGVEGRKGGREGQRDDKSGIETKTTQNGSIN